jgi:hypothetical protein
MWYTKGTTPRTDVMGVPLTDRCVWSTTKGLVMAVARNRNPSGTCPKWGTMDTSDER